MTKKIVLTQGKAALIDGEDFEWLSQWKWRYDKGYAVRSASDANGKQYTVFMHRLIANTPNGLDTDHVDRKGLNNQRSNLRHSTRSQNMMNTSMQTNNTSGFKGVSWHTPAGKWQAKIRQRGKQKHIGYFASAEKAARAYDEAAKMFVGEFARLNFPT